MTLPMIESFLENKIGLSAEAVSPEIIAKAVRKRMTALGLSDLDAYQHLINTSMEEQGKLIETVVVPETWFFRNMNAFRFLGDYIASQWLPNSRANCLRILSMPCSTGEEAYSIAMALADAGIPGHRFQIEGVDISERALEKARTAVYSKGSFRGDDLSFRDRYFEVRGEAYQLCDPVRKAVRFFRGNVLDEGLQVKPGSYDIIFCRNLLIYLSPEAKKRTLEIMDRLLTKSGILFLGHAERQSAVEWGFAGIPEFGVFACRKERRKRPRTPKTGIGPLPRQRRFEKLGATVAPAPLARPVHAVAQSTQLKAQKSATDHLKPAETEENLFDEAQRLADKGSLSSALELCRDFLSEHPVHIQAHFLMGLIYEALDKEEKAEEFFNKAIYLDPEHAEAMNHLSFIVEHRGDKDRATHLRRRAQRASRKLATVAGVMEGP